MFYRQKEVADFQLLLVQAQILTDNPQLITYSKGFPEELKNLLLGVGISGGTAAITVLALVKVFSKMSGAKIMYALKILGRVKAARGIGVIAISVSVVATIGAEVIMMNRGQEKYKKELKTLIRQSQDIEKILVNDSREVVIRLLLAIQLYRSELLNSHKKLMN